MDWVFGVAQKLVNPKGEIVKRAKLFEEEILFATLDNHLSKTQKYLLRIK